MDKEEELRHGTAVPMVRERSNMRKLDRGVRGKVTGLGAGTFELFKVGIAGFLSSWIGDGDG